MGDNRKITMDNLQYYNSKVQEKFKEFNQRLDILEKEVANINEVLERLDMANIDISEFKMILGGDYE